MIRNMDDRIRLWRARRRHVHIDAILERVGRSWVLRFLRNDRPLAALDYPDEGAARSAARVRLRQLEMAGWTDHW
jgi:hypothetical protein